MYNTRLKRPMILMVACICMAAPVGAFELLGFTLFEGKQRNDGSVVELLDPQAYEVRTDIKASKELSKKLLGASELWRRRAAAASGSEGLIVNARSDYRYLLAALYEAGYYAGTISIMINGQEAADLPVTTNLPETADVLIRINPGQKFVFGATGIVNRPDRFLTGSDAPPDTARREFAAGEPALAGIVNNTGDEAVSAWRDQGYAKAKLAERDVIADHATHQLDTRITIEPGRHAKFGPVAVSGAEKVDPEFIKYMADVPNGSFKPKRLEQAQKRLSDLGVFRSVQIVEGDAITPEGELPIEVAVTERLFRRYGVGATLSNIEGFGMEAYWLHRNLFGHAERLRFDARVDGIGTKNGWEEYDYLFGTSFTRPGTFSPDNNLEAAFTIKQQVFETYRERSIDANIGVTRNFDDRLEGSIFLDLEYSQIREDLGTREFLTFGVPFKASFDQRNDEDDPSRGYFLEGEIVPFTELKFNNTAVRANAEGRAYVSFGEDEATVFAARGKIGSIFGGALSELPAGQLFFAGGGGSVRGFPFRSIGIDDGGNITGARSTIEVSLELRHRINDSFGIVGFADAGAVGEGVTPLGDFDPLFSVGAGLRYYTSIGPIRFDVAHPLNPRSDDAPFAFYIGLGQSF